jgi:hypothetical protein
MSGTRQTVLIPGAANILVGSVKLAAGIMAAPAPCSPRRPTRPPARGFTVTIQTCSLYGLPILGPPLCALLG